MKQYYELKIKEQDMLIELYDKLFHLASEEAEDELAHDFSWELEQALKRKLDYISKLESLDNE